MYVYIYMYIYICESGWLVLNLGMMAKEKELKGANSLAMILVTASCTKKTLMKNEQVLCVRLFCICFPGTKKIKKN